MGGNDKERGEDKEAVIEEGEMIQRKRIRGKVSTYMGGM